MDPVSSVGHGAVIAGLCRSGIAGAGAGNIGDRRGICAGRLVLAASTSCIPLSYLAPTCLQCNNLADGFSDTVQHPDSAEARKYNQIRRRVGMS